MKIDFEFLNLRGETITDKKEYYVQFEQDFFTYCIHYRYDVAPCKENNFCPAGEALLRRWNGYYRRSELNGVDIYNIMNETGDTICYNVVLSVSGVMDDTCVKFKKHKDADAFYRIVKSYMRGELKLDLD